MKFHTLVVILFCLLVTVQAQQPDYFPVPDSYQVEGIPPIKKSEVDHLFFEPGTVKSNLIWDADRQNRRLLVTDQTNNIYLVRSPLAQPEKLVEKVVPNSVKMRPDGRAFAYTSDLEDEDNFQLFLYDFEKRTPLKLVTLKGKDESIDYFIWSRNGSSLLYIRADYDLKKSTLCSYDFRRERCFPTEMTGIWEVMDADGDKVLLKHWKASTAQHLYLLDQKTAQLMPVDEKGNSRRAFLAGGNLYWTADGNDLCQREPCLLSMNLKSKKVAQLQLPENLLSINDVKPSGNGKHLLITGSRDGIDYLRVFQLKNNKVTREYLPFLPNAYVVWYTRWMSNSEVVYTIENIGKPASIQSFNIDTKQVTDWTKEKLPPALENRVSAPEVIRWKSFDQREISGYIVRPKSSAKKWPVLIDVHGGPQILDRPLFNSQDIRLASNLDMAIIHTNIRGSSGFGKEFMDADNKEKRGDAVKDIRALLDWVGKQPDLDADKIFLRGGSYGGFIVLSTALHEPNRIRGVIAEYPLVSIRGMLGQSWVDEFATNEYGDSKDEKLMAILDDLSPLNNADRWNKIPLLLTRGKLDSRNPEKNVIDLKDQLRSRG
ncbi:MAG TPA: prolyl oligopeptidase family serine peptidase, partial [Pyrinomonadaceae bacterium]|nr:prolyl oligopeptidase family serine peptidase [Pyrinomonadaceae bacterium]